MGIEWLQLARFTVKVIGKVAAIVPEQSWMQLRRWAHKADGLDRSNDRIDPIGTLASYFLTWMETINR